MSAGFVPLRSRRLLLRPVRRADAAAISLYRDLPQIARYQSWTSFDADAALCMIVAQAGLAPDQPGSWFQLVIVEQATDELVGDLALRVLADDARQVELGVNLSPPHQHRGLATEAIACVLEHLFATLGKHRLFAVTDADNQAAAALFRRAGFRQEAHLVEHVMFKGAYGSEYVFALLAREWAARRVDDGDTAAFDRHAPRSA